MLTVEDARRFLRRLTRRLRKASEGELDALGGLCGRLPLALRVAASLLDERLDWSLADLIKNLDEGVRLRALSRMDDPERNVLAALDLSYRNLTEGLQERFRLLGVFPAPFEAPALAAVWEAGEALSASADEALGALIKRSLIDYRQESRDYALHDLTRLYAQGLLLERADEARTALERHAAHYLALGGFADDLYQKGGEAIAAGLALFDAVWPQLSAAHARLSGAKPG